MDSLEIESCEGKNANLSINNGDLKRDNVDYINGIVKQINGRLEEEYDEQNKDEEGENLYENEDLERNNGEKEKKDVALKIEIKQENVETTSVL